MYGQMVVIRVPIRIALNDKVVYKIYNWRFKDGRAYKRKFDR